MSTLWWGPSSFLMLVRKEGSSKAGFMVGSPRERLLPSVSVTAFPRKGGTFIHVPIAVSGYTLSSLPPGGESAGLMMGDSQRRPLLASCLVSSAAFPWVRGGCTLGERKEGISDGHKNKDNTATQSWECSN